MSNNLTKKYQSSLAAREHAKLAIFCAAMAFFNAVIGGFSNNVLCVWTCGAFTAMTVCEWIAYVNRAHVEKGDLVDVANFAMMIYHNTKNENNQINPNLES